MIIYIVFLYAFVNIFYIVVKETFGENLYNLLLTGENVYTYKRLIYFQKHDFRSFWRITDDIWYNTRKKNWVNGNSILK